jgi:16S rRNA (guanine527-N7)-methyltransferase
MKDGDSRKESEVAVFSLLELGLTELGLTCTHAQLRQLADLVALLEFWASRINLTGHQGPVEITSRLVLDAVALASSLPELSDAATLADLGSGAGFPGLPIAILYPHLHVSLVDSRLKRNHFQREVRRRLALENVSPILGRSDEVEQSACDIVVAQAMTQPRKALEMMAQWSHANSLLVLPASDSSATPACPPGIGQISLREYRVPSVGTLRKLWVARPIAV